VYNYLPIIAPDYTGLILSTKPHNTMEIVGKKSQVAYVLKDGSHKVQEISNQSYFNVSLQWEFLSQIEYDEVSDLWHNPSKANGFERTFKWLNPSDQATYVVRFMSELSIDYNTIGDIQAYGVQLRVEGYTDEPVVPVEPVLADHYTDVDNYTDTDNYTL